MSFCCCTNLGKSLTKIQGINPNYKTEICLISEPQFKKEHKVFFLKSS